MIEGRLTSYLKARLEGHPRQHLATTERPILKDPALCSAQPTASPRRSAWPSAHRRGSNTATFNAQLGKHLAPEETVAAAGASGELRYKGRLVK